MPISLHLHIHGAQGPPVPRRGRHRKPGPAPLLHPRPTVAFLTLTSLHRPRDSPPGAAAFSPPRSTASSPSPASAAASFKLLKKPLPRQIQARFLSLQERVRFPPAATTIWLASSNSFPVADTPVLLGHLLGASSMPVLTPGDRDRLRYALSHLLQTSVSRAQAEALHWLGQRWSDLATIHRYSLETLVCPDGTIRISAATGSGLTPVRCQSGRWYDNASHPTWHCPDLVEALLGPFLTPTPKGSPAESKSRQSLNSVPAAAGQDPTTLHSEVTQHLCAPGADFYSPLRRQSKGSPIPLPSHSTPSAGHLCPLRPSFPLNK
jgi:hypothetical protein